MDLLEKEARIRLYMEKIRKEEEETKKIRLSEEKKLLEDKAQKKLEEEIFKSSKNRFVLEKIQGYLKTKDWINIIEQMNECLFECGYKRLLEPHDNYSQRNKKVSEAIIEELTYPYDPKCTREYVEKIICNDYGISLIYEEINKYDYNANRLSGLKTFTDSIRWLSNDTFFYGEVFKFIRNHVVNTILKYDSSKIHRY